ncbi:DUF4175 family protein [Hymenobacter perfusus]|uniref:DUF4175 family protein n=1 Tax=Hymenobacter perfusus TaxID=1236770 RepID=A0A428K8C0_9BACT|nr:DUF4175 family protein [Hymenobacter perfusus]RSK42726.1 hypothetical protein EI293_13070 [Hymenobacter perfusus]
MSPLVASSVSPQAPVQAAARAWASRQTGALVLLLAGGLALLLTAATVWPAARPGLWALLGLLLAGAGWQLWRIWHEPLPSVARRLNRRHLTLEDSTALLLRPTADLNLLEQLQQQRLLTRLPELAAEAPLLPLNWRKPLAGTLALLVLAGLIWLLQPTSAAAPVQLTEPAVPVHFNEPAGTPAAAPRILITQLRVVPPAYTRQPAFAPATPSFRCPQGSRVRWTVTVNRAAGAPVLELGGRKLLLRPVPDRPTEFVLELPVTASALYRLRFAGQVSDDYAIEVQPDQAPTIRIISPKAYTLVEFGRPPQVVINAQLRDDYGLTRARLVATVAQGQGEAVKFKEVVTDLSSQLRGQPTTATLRPVLRLPALGLTYGDEVYFYLQTWDNQQHLTRSDTYLVQWEDTTVQESALDVSFGVNTAPAYFRSQRQIIIDTEKLLAEQRGLPAATLLERSNGIGFDQKILRMRYGKFLGEEADETIGGATRPSEADAPAEEPGLGSVVAEDHAEPEPAAAAEKHSADDGHDHGHDLPSSSATTHEARTAELMEPYMHRHDDSETADFLEPTVKAKLRAVLSEMWESELRLRTGRPREALPYEYRALRLLKEVQQQTRAYVKKAGFTPPPMPEATTRLTGDLTGAAAPRRQQQVAAPARQPAVRTALRTLTQMQTGTKPAAGSTAALEQVGQELARAALQRPGSYLTALRDLRRLTAALRAGQPAPAVNFSLLERALTNLLPPAQPAPVSPTSPAAGLARRYFQELSR